MSPDLRDAPGSLLATLDSVTKNALATGALQPIETTQSFLDESGVRFLVRVITNLVRKDAAKTDRKEEVKRGRRANPFLPYEPAMHVADVTPTHVALLNKFNVIDRHLLVVTREFEHQERLLTPADFEALHLCMAEYESLGFYNGGEAAGASQEHKHLQLVPLPLADEGPAVPIAPLLTDGGLPFPHALVMLDEERDFRDPVVAEDTCALYRHLLDQLGLGPRPGGDETRQGRPYNLLLTREWMLVVPRSREHFHGVSINALGFAGSLFVRRAEELAPFEEHGPLAALSAVVID